MVLIPTASSLLSPLQYRRIQDFFISSTIQLNCTLSLAIRTEWTFINHSTPGVLLAMTVDASIARTFSELYIPARTLPYGSYELKLTVTMIAAPQWKSSASAFVRITPSGITANLVQFGTSFITRGHDQDLLLDPGTYSVDLDGDYFNASVSLPLLLMINSKDYSHI